MRPLDARDSVGPTRWQEIDGGGAQVRGGWEVAIGLDVMPSTEDFEFEENDVFSFEVDTPSSGSQCRKLRQGRRSWCEPHHTQKHTQTKIHTVHGHNLILEPIL